MDGELVRYAKGEVKPLRQDKELATRAKVIYDNVRLAGLKAEGAIALGGHLMEKVVELDSHRQALAGNDPVLNQMLIEIEASAVHQCKVIQSKLFNGWGM